MATALRINPTRMELTRKPYQYDFRVLRLKGTDAYYVSNSGLNGAALKALARKGLVEKSTVKFFTGYYRLTDAGIEAVR